MLLYFDERVTTRAAKFCARCNFYIMLQIYCGKDSKITQSKNVCMMKRRCVVKEVESAVLLSVSGSGLNQ